jgi:pyrroloquinoline quinone (PQQ) biosynthesis protein C
MTITTAAPEAMPVEEFVDDLVRIMRELKRPEPSRLMVGIFKGTASAEAVAEYTKEQYVYSRFVVHSMASALGKMLERDNFLTLAENFSREAGFYQTSNHVEVLVKFGEALGLTRGEIEGHTPLPETLGAMYTVDYFCSRSAMEAVASFSLATEARGEIISQNREGKRTAPKLSEVFERNYGLSGDAVEFWRLHEEIEGEDAEQGFRMIRPYADSAYNQHRIRQAVVHTASTFDAMWYAWDRFLDA